MWWPAVVKSEWEQFPLRLDYGRSPHAYVNQKLQIQLELLMMSGVPLETCWAFSEQWNNKFYYKVASCWLFLLRQSRVFSRRCDSRDDRIQAPKRAMPWAKLFGAKHTLTKPISCFVLTWNIFVTRRRLPNGRAMSAWEIYSPPRLGMMGCARGFGCHDSIPVGLRCTLHTHLWGQKKYRHVQEYQVVAGRVEVVAFRLASPGPACLLN
jgi:hypothetical protein